MTNQQGAPEALRLAAIANSDGHITNIERNQIARELRRLHAENERLAALVEAQQPVPGVEWQCGPQASGFGQQPAPSAAAADIVELLECSGCLKVGQKDRALAIVARLLPAQHGGVL